MTRESASPGPLQSGSDEAALVRELRDGHEPARRKLFDAHAPRLWRLLYRMTGDYDDAHDLTQETLLQALRKIDSFDGRGSLSGWIARLGVNLARDDLRKRQRRAGRLMQWSAEASAAGGGGKGADPFLRRRIAEAMDALGEDERIVVLMHDMEGYTHEEIAAALGIAAGSSRARLSRARSRLRERLGTLNEENRS